MENSKYIIIDEEPIISYPSTPLNFGVFSKKIIKSPKNLFMSFTPLSSNKHITYTNTIMYPIITTEATIDTEKNYSNLENDKLKLSLKKDSTGLKTESSKDANNNASFEKQISNMILIENNETSKKDEDVHGYGLKSIQYVSKKYKGTTSANVANHLFTLKIVIPLEDKRITK